MDPNLRPGEDLQHYIERQVEEQKNRAYELQDAFASAAATVTSRDGSVTVSLEPNGGLRNIQLGKRACELGEARLSATIMDTVRQAQSQTARAVAASVESIMGDGEVLEMMRGFLPPDPAAGQSGDVDQNKFVENPEPEETPPPQPKPPTTPPPSAGPQPRRRPNRDNTDDDEVNPW
ncbi:YbaB/EbfC family nucleoid-associated protein [Prauserella cavernicola]|uniref:YbaB/EbfC family nucleoid-associated protein n=1 Tax=Prauserella cavernicola TaxID=2800127 RepID=A0A934QZQ6_9PSEU|nr:YbaB/EbfC family nucleoid-associated protein [Prauserella cavernicola]MBK1789215.1 YbaB/EbfC family nucleoid-associated protein [Prauserella cavernicola]